MTASTTTVRDLLDKAKTALAASDSRLRQAAEYIHRAKDQGATQDRIARHVGRSPAWVSILMRWRQGGFQGAPFGPQSRAARQAAQARRRAAATATAIFTRREGEAVSDTGDVTDTRSAASTAPDIIAKAEARRAEAEFKTTRAQAVIAMFGGSTTTVPNGLRLKLVAALMMLPASHPAERARRATGLAWSELIVSAEAESTSTAGQPETRSHNSGFRHSRSAAA